MLHAAAALVAGCSARERCVIILCIYNIELKLATCLLRVVRALYQPRGDNEECNGDVTRRAGGGGRGARRGAEGAGAAGHRGRSRAPVHYGASVGVDCAGICGGRGPAGLSAARERARKKATGRSALLSRGRRPRGPPAPPAARLQPPHTLIFPNFITAVIIYARSHDLNWKATLSPILSSPARLRHQTSIFRMLRDRFFDL
ncbi:unnamed protein product [Danaus chrysippus]|uniref:(African queen) hypothetical protein n=1 Tax=Danaus chrysippus TaxID=151541 RepID=A0A8J2QLT4_9NEOP|nr:unnamed protein product [Danaus chrysippus]